MWNFSGPARRKPQGSEQWIGGRWGLLSTHLPRRCFQSPIGQSVPFGKVNPHISRWHWASPAVAWDASSHICKEQEKPGTPAGWLVDPALSGSNQKGTVNTPRTRGAGGETWATQVGASTAKGMWPWECCPLVVTTRSLQHSTFVFLSSFLIT